MFRALAIGSLLFLVTSCHTKDQNTMSSCKPYAFRLKPGQDLRQEIEKLLKEKQDGTTPWEELQVE